MSIDNCCEMLEAASFHDLDEIFALAVDFVKKNRRHMAETEGWKRVKDNKEILEKIIFELIR